jgi:hypothetical protein
MKAVLAVAFTGCRPVSRAAHDQESTNVSYLGRARKGGLHNSIPRLARMAMDHVTSKGQNQDEKARTVDRPPDMGNKTRAPKYELPIAFGWMLC